MEPDSRLCIPFRAAGRPPDPTCKPTTCKCTSSSSRKIKTSIMDILRHRFRRQRASSGSSYDGFTYDTSAHTPASDRLALKFNDFAMEGSSLIDFFQTLRVADDESVPSTRSRSRNPTSSTSGTDTSIQTAATSVISLRPFKVGFSLAGLAPFTGNPTLDVSIISANRQDPSMEQEIHPSCADLSRPSTSTVQC